MRTHISCHIKKKKKLMHLIFVGRPPVLLGNMSISVCGQRNERRLEGGPRGGLVRCGGGRHGKCGLGHCKVLAFKLWLQP